ncbi:hypothetical protein QE152_g23546 [Popillia japonica]|uniref:Uncharacterized protein n=1 Tax=Popillia japonica TaxID=7064 RepID=A0AAW1KH97_POPJA
MMNLLFLMDYSRWMRNHKWRLVTGHFILMLLVTSAHFLNERILNFSDCLALVAVILFVSFLIQQLLHTKLKIFTSRKEEDEESQFRKTLTLTFSCVTLVDQSFKNIKFFERGVNPCYGETQFKGSVNDKGLKQDCLISRLTLNRKSN